MNPLYIVIAVLSLLVIYLGRKQIAFGLYILRALTYGAWVDFFTSEGTSTGNGAGIFFQLFNIVVMLAHLALLVVGGIIFGIVHIIH